MVQDAVADFLRKGLKGRTKGTIDNYRSLADHNVIPQIGGIKAHDVRLEDISDLVGHSSTSVTETVYRHVPVDLHTARRRAR